MDRIEEYLRTLDKKNIMLLYASIIIAMLAIYYNFNYSVLQKEINTNNQTISSLKHKQKNASSFNVQLKKLKNELKKLKKQNNSLNEDLKYLNMVVKTTPILYINKAYFFDILKKILKKASENNIKASYLISKNVADFKTYTIEIKGEFEPSKFDSFYKFVKDLENIKAIKEIKYLNFSKKDNVIFEMKILFWSLL